MFGDRLIRVAHHAFVLLLVVWSAIALTAQTVVDPRFVEFAPSADHSTLAPDGTPLVQRYSLTVFVVGSTTPLDTMDLGKPAPSAGIIRVDFLPLMNTPPPAGVILEARVTAIGPGGSTPSAVSNQFSFQSTCAPNISSTSASVGAGASTGSVGVTAGTGCTWSAVSNASWVTLTGATSGTGNGTVPYSVAANTSTSQRTGTLTVAGKTYTITQAGAPCSYAIAPTSQSVVAGGGHGVDERHDAERVCVDRGQQQHELVDGDGGGLGERQRDGQLQHDGECEHESAHGHPHGGWPDVDGDAGGGAM